MTVASLSSPGAPATPSCGSRKPGYTAVERRASIPAGSSATLFDARLTPLDPSPTLVASAVGGQARNQSGRATLQIPPGGLTTDQSISLTLLSPQGLGALLPAGWSPIAAVNVGPGELSFGFPLTLTVPSTATLPQNASLTLARYDTASHDWIAVGTATVDPGGLTLRTAIERGGQFALLVPDAAPFTPADPTPGATLTGVERPANQTTGVTAVGEVVPRSAPPGDEARALGRVGVTTPAPAPSGTFIQARVSERFDLFDQTQVVTQPFTQDLVSYAMPRPGVGGALGAAFPITPSRNFTIQELMLGVVRLDVTAFARRRRRVGHRLRRRHCHERRGRCPASAAGGSCRQHPSHAPPADRWRRRHHRARWLRPHRCHPGRHDRRDAHHAGAAFDRGWRPHGAGSDSRRACVQRPFRASVASSSSRSASSPEDGWSPARRSAHSRSPACGRAANSSICARSSQPDSLSARSHVRAPRSMPGVLVTSDSVGVADVTGADGRYLVAGRIGVDTTCTRARPGVA